MNQSRGLFMQGGMVFTVSIQFKERIGLSLDGRHISQIGVLEDVSFVILMEPFHRPVTLGMAHGREKEFGAHQQGQAHTLTQHIRMGKTAAKAALIIDLSVTSNAHSLPDVDQKGSGIPGPAAGKDLPSRIARDHINGVKTEDLLPPL